MYLAARPDGRNLYASDQAPLGRLAALSITPGTGVLVALSQVPSGGAQSVHTAVHPGGNWVFVANYDLPGNLKVFPLLPNGALGTPTDDEITGPGAHQCAISPDGKHVYLPTRSLAYIAQYSFDDQTGQLTPLVPATVAAEDPRHLAFNRDGTRAYLVNEMQIPLLDAGVPLAGSETRATNVAVYSVANGNLTEIQKVVLDPDERGGGAIRVSPDGKFLYVSGRFSQTIYSLAIDPVDGKLAPAGEFNGDGLIDTPRDFIIDPLGNHLLVASADLSQLVILKIDKATGQLATTGAPIPAPRYTGAVLLVPQTAP
jgi:6-phosphogluconolactonase